MVNEGREYIYIYIYKYKRGGKWREAERERKREKERGREEERKRGREEERKREEERERENGALFQQWRSSAGFLGGKDKKEQPSVGPCFLATLHCAPRQVSTLSSAIESPGSVQLSPPSLPPSLSPENP